MLRSSRDEMSTDNETIPLTSDDENTQRHHNLREKHHRHQKHSRPRRILEEEDEDDYDSDSDYEYNDKGSKRLLQQYLPKKFDKESIKAVAIVVLVIIVLLQLVKNSTPPSSLTPEAQKVRSTSSTSGKPVKHHKMAPPIDDEEEDRSDPTVGATKSVLETESSTINAKKPKATPSFMQPGAMQQQSLLAQQQILQQQQQQQLLQQQQQLLQQQNVLMQPQQQQQQQPGMMQNQYQQYQQPGMMQPGMMQQQQQQQQPGMVMQNGAVMMPPQQNNMMSIMQQNQQPGMMQPGMMQGQTGMVQQQPLQQQGVIPSQQGMMQQQQQHPLQQQAMVPGQEGMMQSGTMMQQQNGMNVAGAAQADGPSGGGSTMAHDTFTQAAGGPDKDDSKLSSDLVEGTTAPTVPSDFDTSQIADKMKLEELSNFKETWDPYEDKDNPIFWHIPKAGGSSVKDVIGSCHRLVMATEFGVTDGHDQDTEIAIVYPKVPGVDESLDRSPFVNVDTTTVAGIARASQMGFADSGLAQCVVTPFLYEANELFTPTAKGRLFSVFRHPVDRAISMFYYIQVATWEPTYKPELQSWTLEQYATSEIIENNWMVRQLSNTLGGDLNEGHLQIAMEVIRRKFLVGLMTKLEESMTRFEKFFRWKYHVNPTNQEVCRERLTSGGSNSNAKNKKEKPKSGEPTWELIAAQNVYDIQLYEYIETLFTEQEAFVTGVPDDFRKIDATCCKCDPPSYPPEGFACPKKVTNSDG